MSPTNKASDSASQQGALAGLRVIDMTGVVLGPCLLYTSDAADE